jgi:3-hydroxybutyryl-CoA dehydrogenase
MSVQPTVPVGVIGFGMMGAGIAQVCAAAGRDVVVVDVSEERLADGRAAVERFTARGVERGRLAGEQRSGLLERIRTSTDLGALAGADVVIEAVTEDPATKRDVLARAAAAAGERALVATNTSALSVTSLAASVPVPERFVGLHFLSPAPLMPLVEVVRALQSGPEQVERAVAFAEEIGKVPVVVKDRPGFLVNSLLMPYLNQAIEEFDRGLGDAGDIDLAVRLGLGYPSGPLELLDRIGLDTHLHATRAAYEQTGHPSLAPPPLLQQLVAAGRLGRKTGRGLRAIDETGAQA